MTVAKTQKPRIVCVTGASSGIGEAVAETFARQGDILVIGARRLDRLEHLSLKLKEWGATEVFAHALDVCNPTSIQEFYTQVYAKYPSGFDILVNNAGLALSRDHVVNGDPTEWDTMFHTNVLGLLRMTKFALEKMIPKQSGHIVMIGSIAGHQVYEGGAAYAASKFSVKAITESLKLELCGTSVKVTSIDPGMVETEFSLVRFKGNEQEAAKVYDNFTPLTGADVAHCVNFVTNLPKHVNIDQMIVMPTDQASVTKSYRPMKS